MAETDLKQVNGANPTLGQKCLGLIRDIAERGAASSDPSQVGYAIQELRQVLSERPGSDERVFEPVPEGEIHDLAQLHEELVVVDEASQSIAAGTA